MLPSTTIHPPPPAADDHHHHAAKKPNKFELKTTLHSVKSQIPAHHCIWLTAVVLLQLVIILFLNHASPPPSLPPFHRLHFEPSSSHTSFPAAPEKTCKYGRIYVYDLPDMLNKDLIDNCQNLDPWSSRCNAVSNGGFGPPATGLDGIIPQNLTPAWYWTDMYAAEVIYHGRMTSHKCTTSNQSEATAFYIPFYAGLAVGKYLWFNHTSEDRDRHAVAMLNWVKNQDPFKNSNGSDHFIMLGRLTWEFRRLTDNDDGWGTKFLYMPLMENVLRLGVERSQWDGLEISVPYPTAFHPRSESDIRQWQDFIRVRKRSNLFTFVGAARKKIRNDFRGALMDYCKNESVPSCRVVDCSIAHCYDGAPAILESFLDSDFCLQPKGDGYTRRSAFDCMLAGSIPVYFWRGSFEHQYEWHLPKQASVYSVFIDHKVVRNDTSIVERVLGKYSREEVKRMRETIIDFLPRLLYWRSDTPPSGTVNDAFDITMEGVLRRFKDQTMRKLRFPCHIKSSFHLLTIKCVKSSTKSIESNKQHICMIFTNHTFNQYYYSVISARQIILRLCQNSKKVVPEDEDDIDEEENFKIKWSKIMILGQAYDDEDEEEDKSKRKTKKGGVPSAGGEERPPECK